MSEHVVIVIPAYNEEQTIIGVIRGLKTRGFARIVVVDDGSRDRTAELAFQEGAVVVRHLINRGFGGAIGTALRAALQFDADIIVTFDADGQHDPDDISPLIEPIEQRRADVVIGSRRPDAARIPVSRRVAHRIANLATYVLFGLHASDTQSGLRAFSRQAAERVRLTTSGMEASSEIFAEIARNQLRLTEVPINAIYTAYSLSKGQSFKVGLRTLAKLILAKLRRLGQ